MKASIQAAAALAVASVSAQSISVGPAPPAYSSAIESISAAPEPPAYSSAVASVSASQIISAAPEPPAYSSAVASVSTQTVSAAPAPPAYSSAEPVSYVTVTYEDCPNVPIETLITVTNGKTVTYCPECQHPPTSVPATTSSPAKHTTVYTTTYMSLCPTGTVPATYTITETCDDDEPTWTPGPSYVPQGFTVTVKECTACDKTPVPVTITEPCDCEATSGTPVPPKPTGPVVEQISDGQVQVPATGGNSPAPSGGAGSPPEGHVPASSSGSGSGSGGGSQASNVPTGPANTSPTAAPYPTPTTTVKCPGPECRAHATGGAAMPTGVMPLPPSGGDSSEEMTPPAFQGGAASYAKVGFVTSLVLSILVGGLAFAL